MQKIISFLNFFNLLDSQNRLSITNVAVLIILGKMILAPSVSLTEVGALLISFINYGHKRFTNAQQPTESPLDGDVNALKEKMSEVSSQISTLSLKVGLK